MSVFKDMLSAKECNFSQTLIRTPVESISGQLIKVMKESAKLLKLMRSFTTDVWLASTSRNV